MVGSLVLIPWAETAWSAAGRIAGRTPQALTNAGRQQAETWADQLATGRLRFIYSSDERTSVETARIVVDRTGAAWKIDTALAELDFGLWDGLTTDELKRRYPKIFKRWLGDPSSVRPPEGEDATDALDRLRASLEGLTRRRRHKNVGVVLGPLAFALARCWLETAELTEARSLVLDRPLRYPWQDRAAGTGSELATEVVAAHGTSHAPPEASAARPEA